MASEIQRAMADARRAGEGGPIDGFVERIAARVGAQATVRAVFGEPIERDGITIIPVAKVRWGFGGGSGGGPFGMEGGIGAEGGVGDTAPGGGGLAGFGSGGGGGVTADPVGYLEIGPDGASFVPISPVMPSPGFLLAVGAMAALVLRGLARLLRR